MQIKISSRSFFLAALLASFIGISFASDIPGTPGSAPLAGGQDPEAQNLAQNIELQQRLISATHDPQQKMAALTQLQNLRIAQENHQVLQVYSAARQGDPNALMNLLGYYNRYTGGNATVSTDTRGGFALFQNGKQFTKVMSADVLADMLYQVASPAMRQKTIQNWQYKAPK